MRNTQIHMTNTKPLINTVRQHQQCFLGHIHRMPEDEPRRRYALFFPELIAEEDQSTEDTFHISCPEAIRGYDLHQDAIASLLATG